MEKITIETIVGKVPDGSTDTSKAVPGLAARPSSESDVEGSYLCPGYTQGSYCGAINFDSTDRSGTLFVCCHCKMIFVGM
jgi:hypothetical protein